MHGRISQISDIYLGLNQRDRPKIEEGRVECIVKNSLGQDKGLVFHVVDETDYAKDEQHFEFGFLVRVHPPKANYENIEKYEVFIDKENCETLLKKGYIVTRWTPLGAKIDITYWEPGMSLR
ncbi:hypothetical protein GOV06_03695 [Candidatus Woesearchaeota archaeon]|nr:hypothetical protein [Candidatus Woesearchaeota archaeon]